MEEWQRRQRHDTDIRGLLTGDEMDARGRLRAWRGAKSFAKLATRGHSSVGYEQCACRAEGARIERQEAPSPMTRDKAIELARTLDRIEADLRGLEHQIGGVRMFLRDHFRLQAGEYGYDPEKPETACPMRLEV